MSTLAVFLGEIEGLGGERECTLGPGGGEVRLGKPHQPDRLIGLELHGHRPLDRVLEQGQRLREAPGVHIRRAQGGGDERPRPRPGLVRLAGQATLQDGDRPSKSPFATHTSRDPRIRGRAKPGSPLSAILSASSPSARPSPNTPGRPGTGPARPGRGQRATPPVAATSCAARPQELESPHTPRSLASTGRENGVPARDADSVENELQGELPIKPRRVANRASSRCAP